jgi:sulfate adenylyltransferase large subunit
MQNSNLKFVIVGHVDHGKSTLIGRLLYDTNSLSSDKMEEVRKISENLGRDTEFAYLLDHLEEERQQGITIETTQVFFKTGKKEYVIIDAPGHVEFVKNMVTGASQAEAAILIVDIKEGIKEQTKRHAYILSLLGLKQVVVVVNKMDLVNFEEGEFGKIKDELGKFLDSIAIKPAFYIPICALKGENIARRSENMPWYNGLTVLESLDTLKNIESEYDKPLIFPVQDVYKIDDKRISVGRIESGILRAGETVEVIPSLARTKINSIEIFMKQSDQASAGDNIGVTTVDSLFIDRGNVICEPKKEPLLTDSFKATIFWMSRKDFSKDEKLTIRCATQETSCKIGAILRRINSSSLEIIEKNASTIKNLEVAEVSIKTKKPIAIKAFNDVRELGRFVLVHDDNICAGGIIANI